MALRAPKFLQYAHISFALRSWAEKIILARRVSLRVDPNNIFFAQLLNANEIWWKRKYFQVFFWIIWSFLVIFAIFIDFWSRVFYSKWAAIINNEGTSQKARHILKWEEKPCKKHICSAHNCFRTTRSEARENAFLGPWTRRGDHGLVVETTDSRQVTSHVHVD